jgi:sugar lactone lactonase YvrE
VIRRVTLIAFVFCLASSGGAIDRAHYRELTREARQLGQKKNWAGMKRVLLEIHRELPADTPRQMLTMASVEMHLENKAEALRWMEKYAATGLTYDVAADEDLASLENDPSFSAIAAKLKANKEPIKNAQMVCTLPIADLMPEDLTYEKSSKTFFTSSVQHHTVYRMTLPKQGTKDCTATELPLADDAKRWPTLAISTDAHRKLLWVSTSAMPGFAGLTKDEEGKAAVLAIDPESGKTLRRLDLVSDAAAVLGDMSIAEDGTVYVTDSVGGGVYRVAAGELSQTKLEKIADGLFSPQTPILTRDGKRLLVADYSMGIAVVQLQSKNVEYLKHPDNVAVTGLDGLLTDGNGLIGIQNGVDPERIVRFRLNKEQTEIVSAEVMEQATERLGEATHVIKVGEWNYVIANVGWDKIQDNGQLKPGKQFIPPVLLRFRAH